MANILGKVEHFSDLTEIFVKNDFYRKMYTMIVKNLGIKKS